MWFSYLPMKSGKSSSSSLNSRLLLPPEDRGICLFHSPLGPWGQPQWLVHNNLSINVFWVRTWIKHFEEMASLIRRDIATMDVHGRTLWAQGHLQKSRTPAWQEQGKLSFKADVAFGNIVRWLTEVSFAFLKIKLLFTYNERYTFYVFSALNFGDCMHLCNYQKQKKTKKTKNKVQNISITWARATTFLSSMPTDPCLSCSSARWKQTTLW